MGKEPGKMYQSKPPQIKPVDNDGYIRIQFVINGVKYKANPIYRGNYNNPVHLAKAESIAAQIKHDIATGLFDYSDTKLSKYCIKKELPSIVTSKAVPNLLELWNLFEERQKGRVEETTIKQDYSRVRNALSKLTTEQLKLDNVHLLADILLNYYSAGTLQKVFTHLKACGNWAVKSKTLTDNPFIGLTDQLPKQKNKHKKPECFTVEEIPIIIKAFRSDTYTPKESRFKHSHYADFIEFLFLTGCRPEDAIALTWNDIKQDKITFSKAYSSGVLKGSKTGVIRTFPINSQLKEFLERRKTNNPNSHDSLIFPSPTGKYIDLHNFTNRCWRKVVKQLVAEGKVSQYLPLYNVRHTFITLMLRKGIDMQTIAMLCGTSIQMLKEHYWSPDRQVKLPEI